MKRHNQRQMKNLKKFFLDIAGWLIPLIISGPSLFIWAGLMTMPLLVYLVIMLLSLFNPNIDGIAVPDEPYIITAVTVLLLGGPHWPDKVISILGIFIMVYAAIYLRIKRKNGLVTSGPYRYVRNPQYLGAVLFTINLTSRSYREVLGDIGWLGPTGTLLVWFGMLVAYILLASVEELYMTREYGEVFSKYKTDTPLLIPFIRTHHRWLELLLSVTIPVLLLFSLVFLNRILFP
jgi:protein-S-isoprenylcysteine O-methyltransferase Ste14